MSDSHLTAARLRELLDYDPETGIFTRLVRASQCKPGSVAGSINGDGYIVFTVDKTLYYAHRLAWLYTYGSWPKSQIDHINGVRFDNRLCNIRDVTNSINTQNQRKVNGVTASGFLGVHKNGNKWAAQIGLNGKCKYLGTFETPNLAHAAYLEAKRAMHPGCTI